MGKGVSSRDLSHTDRGRKNGGSQFTFHGLTITLSVGLKERNGSNFSREMQIYFMMRRGEV